MTPRALLVPLLLAAAPWHDGDRVFAARECVLRAEPSARARPVRTLLAGDELSVLTDPDALRPPPADWTQAATIEAPSGRAFSGWIETASLSAQAPGDAAREAVLRAAVERGLSELEARAPAFATLREQAIRRRGAQDGGPAGERLTRRLADYMAAEVSPLALDAMDRIAALRALDNPAASRLSRRLAALARSFQP